MKPKVNPTLDELEAGRQREAKAKFPIGGPRQAVYDALSSRQFKMDGFGDKHWTRLDGLTAHVYGTGSCLRVRREGADVFDGLMADGLAKIDELDKALAANRG